MAKSHVDFESVVRVDAVTQSWAYESPWQTRSPRESTGSGVVVGECRILTGAHVVADATFLQVQKVGDATKHRARIEAVWHDCDLALLSVDSDGFMNDVVIAELGELPNLRDSVSVVGYPLGGDEVSITEGIVSRIEVQTYTHSQRDLLAVTIDAAINYGNSGGPVFLNGRVSGIAFQGIDEAQNIGHMVSAPTIRRFLEGSASEAPPGIPGLGVRLQTLENPDLRASIGLDAKETGVLITAVEYGSSAWGTLKEGDALLDIDGYSIANNGTIQYRTGVRTDHYVLMGDHAIGDEIPITILRDGQRLDRKITLKPAHGLVQNQYSERPRYFVFGGIVFQPLTRNYLELWDPFMEKAPQEFIDLYWSGIRSEDRQEVIFVSSVLPDEINLGYHDFAFQTVQTVNEVKPKNLKHLAELIEDSNGTVKIRTRSQVIVMDTDAAQRSSDQILERYGVTADRYLGD